MSLKQATSITLPLFSLSALPPARPLSSLSLFLPLPLTADITHIILLQTRCNPKLVRLLPNQARPWMPSSSNPPQRGTWRTSFKFKCHMNIPLLLFDFFGSVVRLSPSCHFNIRAGGCTWRATLSFCCSVGRSLINHHGYLCTNLEGRMVLRGLVPYRVRTPIFCPFIHSFLELRSSPATPASDNAHDSSCSFPVISAPQIPSHLPYSIQSSNISNITRAPPFSLSESCD